MATAAQTPDETVKSGKKSGAEPEAIKEVVIGGVLSPEELEKRKGLFVWPGQPTQVDKASGVQYDFNYGCRVGVPAGPGWMMEFRDAMTGHVFWRDFDAGGKVVTSNRKYYTEFEIRATLNGEEKFRHRLNLKDRPVLVRLPTGTLGDSIGWIPYVDKFQQKHGCKLTCLVSPEILTLIGDSYPNIDFRKGEDIDPLGYYATYYLGLFFDDAQKREWNWQPYDHRFVGLHRTAGYILGVDPTETKLKIQLGLEGDERPIKEKYVVIATKASTRSKMWNNGMGWVEVNRFLTSQGYRVICIDQKPDYGDGWQWNLIPHGCEDQTGDRPLAERARWIKHADAFIGLGSGLSWLAWLTETPVVLISGFSHPTTEFHTPYRVINTNVCNSCWNDPAFMFDNKDRNWCPRKANTPEQFECTTQITSEYVINVLKTIPGFGMKIPGEKR